MNKKRTTLYRWGRHKLGTNIAKE